MNAQPRRWWPEAPHPPSVGRSTAQRFSGALPAGAAFRRAQKKKAADRGSFLTHLILGQRYAASRNAADPAPSAGLARRLLEKRTNRSRRKPSTPSAPPDIFINP